MSTEEERQALTRAEFDERTKNMNKRHAATLQSAADMVQRGLRPGYVAAHEDIGRRIVGAAIRNKEQGWVVVSVRHFDYLMHQQLARMNADGQGTEQGFVCNRGDFWTREEAWDIAIVRGQILRLVSGEGRLYSENLY